MQLFVAVRLKFHVPTQSVSDLVVVDDQVAGFGVGFDVGGFAGAGWSDDEGDVGVGGLPAVVLFAVDALVVAVGAGCSEVVGVPPLAAFGDGDDVVDLGGYAGAFGCSDLALVVVSGEDGFAYCGPGASLGGVMFFGHRRCGSVSGS